MVYDVGNYVPNIPNTRLSPKWPTGNHWVHDDPNPYIRQGKTFVFYIYLTRNPICIFYKSVTAQVAEMFR